MKDSTKTNIIQVLADISTVILISIVFVLIFSLVHPFDRGFHCNDETIRYPYKPDTIPLWAAGVYGSVGAIFIVIVTELFKSKPCCIESSEFKIKRKTCNTAIIHGILFYILGAAATLLITEVGKHTIGRLRPHFFSVCKPKWNEIDCFEEINGVKVAKYIQFKYDLCTGDPHLIREARLSFPSGHSSFTVYSMIFIIIYLEARLSTLKRTRFVKASIQLLAFIAAWHTCMSRVSDFKHHYTDVIAGAIIGFSVALFCTVIMGKVLWSFGIGIEFPNEAHESERREEIENYDNAVSLPIEKI